ncbi:MAG TPA: non-ribosomal peptide synthetase, partial [Thermoanaerobaculia bacterium]|nr:non-ribosomal peptide synthetase [Thermoanaerobaculia bacterium]
GELATTAAALASELRAAGAERNRLVAIVMEKGWEQAAAALAVLEAGAAYLPIDPGLPAERLTYLLANGGVRIALTQPALAASLAWPAGVQRIEVAAVVNGPAGRPAAIERSDEDLAYVIFTSGSTGLPKGVMIDHRGALNTVVDVNSRFGVGASDRVFAISALNFDLSVYDLFGPLAAGGAIAVPEAEALREPARWSELADAAGVTIWNSVPALVEMWVDHLESRGERLPASLRLIMMSGDWIPVSLPDRIRRLGASVEVISMGGATEASIWSILYPIGEVDPSWPSIPYGRPMVNQTFHVLDDALAPRPAWVAGDLYIGGIGVAKGYWGDEERTRAAFVVHPETGERLYRTGDIGRYLPSGDIEFLGREDAQVKIQGFRIELGEIEAALATHPAVRTAVAAAIGPRRGPRRLVAYVVPAVQEGDLGLPVAALREHLAAKLPSYMVPTTIVALDALPLTANGKVDRAALPDPEAVAAPLELVPPRDEVEAALAELYTELLGVERVSVRDGFFDLGGHSMVAVRLLGRVRSALGVELPLASLLAGGSVEALAAAVRAARGGDLADTGDLVEIQPAAGSDRRPLFLVHAVGGSVLSYAGLARALGAGQPVWGLQAPSAEELPAVTLEALAARYVAGVRRVQPAGPYQLGGWSMGGTVAYEMARQLTAAGEAVALVAMIDSDAPSGPEGGSDIDDATLEARFEVDLAAVSADALAPEDFARLFAVFRRNYRALLAYAPLPYGGPVTLLVAEDGYGPAGAAAWSALAPAAEVVRVAGDHYTLLGPPHRERLAAELARRLGGGADTSGGSGQ